MQTQLCKKCGTDKFTEVILTLHSGVSICEDGYVEHDFDSEDVKTHYPEPHYVCEECDIKHTIVEGVLQKVDE